MITFQPHETAHTNDMEITRFQKHDFLTESLRTNIKRCERERDVL